jgi:L-malate glycosyltransferase
VRIVHVASGREWRGGQRQVWLLARELQARGVSQVVITTSASELSHRLSQAGVPVQPATWQVGLDPRVLPALLTELRGPALVHAHDAHALTLAGVGAWLTSCPLVVTRRVTFPLRRRFFWGRACRIIVISRAVKEALIRDGIDDSKLVLIPSALDPAVPAAAAVDLRTRLRVSHKGQLAVALGSLTPEKDHLTLIQAASRLVQDLPDLRWIIVGEGPMEERLQQRIRELGVQDRMHLVGGLQDPHQALAEADVFVLSSTSEGFGSSVLAAMARGVPVVATRVGGVPDLLANGSGILVEPQSPDALAGAVRLVLSDSVLRESLAQKARAELPKYTASAMAERVLSVYRSCAHSLDGA